MKGLKIEFEGTDGAGKTTALKYFIEKARERGLSVVETREVGNPHIPACVKMREFVLDSSNNLTGEAMELIFSAMRFENDAWLNKLRASKDCPDFVVSDRGWLSHLAYTDHNVNQEFTEEFYDDFVGYRTQKPNVVIYFSVDTNTALKRRQRRGIAMDVIEQKGIAYQEKVRESFRYYLELAEFDSIQIFEVDANQDLASVQADLDKILDNLLLANMN